MHCLCLSPFGHVGVGVNQISAEKLGEVLTKFFFDRQKTKNEEKQTSQQVTVQLIKT